MQKFNQEQQHHGTYGRFQIDVDARGTETNLIYDINIGFTNKPQNLKIYLDENMTQEINIVNNTFNYSKFLSYSDAQTLQQQPFYWNWPLETGETEAEINLNDIEDSKSMNKTMSMQIAVTGTQANTGGANINYNGNGSTSGGMISNVINENTSVTLASNQYRKAYTVSLDANGGSVSNNKLVAEYEFSHWSTDGRNSNVLYHSTQEKYRLLSENQYEFMQYADLAPYIDENGTEDYYFLSFDIKSADVSNYNKILCYFQNGSNSRYKFNGDDLRVLVTTNYEHKAYNKKINLVSPSVQNSQLAFYGVYGTGNSPIVKNVTFDIGSGYEDLQEINYSDIANNSTSLNLYAKWIPKSVTLPTPTKEGYTFSGWYTQKEGGVRVDNTYTPTQNITLYAHWE